MSEVHIWDRTNSAQMSMVKTWNTESGETIHTGFGVFDKKGREIGAVVTTGYLTTHELPEGYDPGEIDEHCRVIREETKLPEDYRRVYVLPGTYYTMHTHSTRGGARFGSGRTHRRFSTREARDAAVAKYLADAKKRAKPGK